MKNFNVYTYVFVILIIFFIFGSVIIFFLLQQPVQKNNTQSNSFFYPSPTPSIQQFMISKDFLGDPKMSPNGKYAYMKTANKQQIINLKGQSIFDISTLDIDSLASFYISDSYWTGDSLNLIYVGHRDAVEMDFENPMKERYPKRKYSFPIYKRIISASQDDKLFEIKSRNVSSPLKAFDRSGSKFIYETDLLNEKVWGYHLWMYDSTTDKHKQLSNLLDESYGRVVWQYDGKAFIAERERTGAHKNELVYFNISTESQPKIFPFPYDSHTGIQKWFALSDNGQNLTMIVSIKVPDQNNRDKFIYSFITVAVDQLYDQDKYLAYEKQQESPDVLQKQYIEQKQDAVTSRSADMRSFINEEMQKQLGEISIEQISIANLPAELNDNIQWSKDGMRVMVLTSQEDECCIEIGIVDIGSSKYTSFYTLPINREAREKALVDSTGIRHIVKEYTEQDRISGFSANDDFSLVLVSKTDHSKTGVKYVIDLVQLTDK